MAKKSNKSGGEYEHHVVAVRMRVIGAGDLEMALTDLDDIQTQDLVPFTLASTTRIEPTRLANFQSQRIRFELQVTEIDEWFQISKILVFAKPVAVEYPM